MKQVREVADFYKKYVPGCEKLFIADISRHVGVRASRRIRGIETVSDADAIELRHYRDSIAKASWGIDVWPADSYTKPANESSIYPERNRKLQEGDWFDIRYGCIVTKDVDNLLCGGRIISTDFLSQAAVRLQQTCMQTGEAAGCAAALSVKRNISPTELDGSEVSALLDEYRKAMKKPYFLI